MADRIDIYNRQRRLQHQLDRLSDGDVRPEDARQIRRFADQCIAEGLSLLRTSKYVYLLSRLSGMSTEPFERWRRKHVTAVVRQVEQSGNSPWSKHDFKVTLKKFFRWLRNTEEGYPPEVRWLRTTVARQHAKLPEELLDQDEVRRMVAAADTPRDKALIHTLYESGCRVGELASLRLKHVVFDDAGAQIVVSGKTGARRVRLITAVPDLSAWVNVHPLRDHTSAPLWINTQGHTRHQPMRYDALRAAVKRTAARAKINKRVHPHIFRHSRATHLAKHLTEAQMKEFFGWVQGSEMAATYVHLSGRDVDEALFRLHGLKQQETEKRKDKLKPRECPRCKFTNSASGQYCSQCRMPLDLQTAMQAEQERRPHDDLMSELVRDPEVQAVLARKLRQMGPETKAPAADADGESDR